MIRAALLDDRGVYLLMDELADASLLTARHLPRITACDLPSEKYQWISDRDPLNPYGGAFWPIVWLARVERDRQATADAAARTTSVTEWKAGRVQAHQNRKTRKTAP